MTLDDNAKLQRLVLAARRIERLLDEFKQELSAPAKDSLRAALDTLNRDFQKALRRLQPAAKKRKLKVADGQEEAAS